VKIDFFHKFFPVSLVEKIIAETNAYAVRCIQVRPDKVWVPTTFPEMMAFLGFISHCLQQRARLFIHFHSYILEICVTKYRKRKYHMAEKSFLKMNFIGSPLTDKSAVINSMLLSVTDISAVNKHMRNRNDGFFRSNG
jgi:hypothetical protein